MKKALVLLALAIATPIILPASARADDGVTDIRIDPAAGATINAPGSYRLVGNVTLTGTTLTAVTILAIDVTLDLGGHTINAAAGATLGVGISAVPNPGMTIMNGVIKGFPGSAIMTGGRAAIRNIRAEGNNKIGGLSVINLGDNATVEGCLIANNSPASGSTTALNVGAGSRIADNIIENNDSTNNFAKGIVATSGACEIFDNIVRGNTGSAAGDCMGIDANGTRNIIRGNIVTDNDNTGTGGVIGIRAGSGCIIEGNTCSDHTLGATATGDCIGISAGTDCLIERNDCVANTTSGTATSDATGISTLSVGRVVGNTCRNNSASGGGIARGIKSSSASMIKDNLCILNSATGAGGKARGIEASIECTIQGNSCIENSGTVAVVVAEAIGIVITGDRNLVIGNHTVTHSSATLIGGIHLEAAAGANRVQENVTSETGFDVQNDGGVTNSIPAVGNHLENIAY